MRDREVNIRFVGERPEEWFCLRRVAQRAPDCRRDGGFSTGEVSGDIQLLLGNALVCERRANRGSEVPLEAAQEVQAEKYKLFKAMV